MDETELLGGELAIAPERDVGLLRYLFDGPAVVERGTGQAQDSAHLMRDAERLVRGRQDVAVTSRVEDRALANTSIECRATDTRDQLSVGGDSAQAR